MTRYVFFNPVTGQVVQTCTGGHPESIAMSTGLGYIASDEHIKGEAWVADGVLHQPPAKPGPHHDWDWASKSWVLTLARARDFQWEHIKKSRDAAEFGGFSWDGSVFDSDLVSQSRIQGGVMGAKDALEQGVSLVQEWTLADNTIRELTPAQMVNVGRAMSMHIAAQHMIGRQLRQMVYSATDLDQILAVQWPDAA